jgi:hypothetical protein
MQHILLITPPLYASALPCRFHNKLTRFPTPGSPNFQPGPRLGAPAGSELS